MLSTIMQEMQLKFCVLSDSGEIKNNGLFEKKGPEIGSKDQWLLKFPKKILGPNLDLIHEIYIFGALRTHNLRRIRVEFWRTNKLAMMDDHEPNQYLDSITPFSTNLTFLWQWRMVYDFLDFSSIFLSF